MPPSPPNNSKERIKKDSKKDSKKATESNFFFDFVEGGFARAVSKTYTAPLEQAKLLLQTQDSNPAIINGTCPRFIGIVDCITRVSKEEGIASLWRGNTVNMLRYFPTQACNLIFKKTIKGLFPRYSTRTDYWKALAVNVAAGGLAAGITLLFVYPLDVAHTRLAVDVGSTRQFSGTIDCISQVA
jgi:solute carrier family 25 (adenine nucleotide translocator) protein 4/5/6/31